MTDELAEIFREALDLDDGFRLEDRMGRGDVPCWDSLGHVLLVIELEARLGTSLNPDQVIALDTVGAVRALLSQAGRHGE